MSVTPETLVKNAEAAYLKQDLETIMQLFDPDIVVYWNGKKIAEGLDELRKLHEEWGIRKDFVIKKTLRAAAGNNIAVEWQSSWTDSDGKRNEGFGGEFWTMQNNRLKEWHAYYTRYVEGDSSAASNKPT